MLDYTKRIYSKSNSPFLIPSTNANGNTMNVLPFVCQKSLLGSKDGVLWRVRGYAVPSQYSPSPVGGGVGVGAVTGVLTPEKDFFDKLTAIQ